MLGLKLREEFTGSRAGGTIIDFSNRRGTGALDRSAKDFLAITYPSIDLLKTIEAVQPDSTRPVVIIGSRGQGKSHLMAALAQMLKDVDAGSNWLHQWSSAAENSAVGNLALRQGMHVIAESLHLHNYKFLWDLLFDNHPAGTYARGAWEGQGANKTEVPGYAVIREMLEKQPAALILDEFQTWYEGLTNSKQYPWRNWAFNFIQILSEIARQHPELLLMVVSVRDGTNDAAQQMYRIDPVRIDFKSPQAKRDRRRLLLYRMFENRLQIPRGDIEALSAVHVEEYLRLRHIPTSEHGRHRDDFAEAWPFSPVLLDLLDDQVLIAVEAQDTRDLLRILVDVYKTAKGSSPVITPADFSITAEKSGVGALLDSVSSQMHRDLRQKARRNLEAVQEALSGTAQAADKAVPHLDDILSALWLRSLSVENLAGAEPDDLHIDVTRDKPIDDNHFQVELDLIREHSFNIHPRGNRLVFLNEENAEAKLRALASNDRMFQSGEDIAHLADAIRYILGGAEAVSGTYRVIVLRRNWQSGPWAEVDEKDQPKHWDGRIPVIVLPSSSAGDAELGEWLKGQITTQRNTPRFLLPRKGSPSIFDDKPLLVLARAVHLANQWKAGQPEYAALAIKYQKELRLQLRTRFDRFAVLEIWNYQSPKQCTFAIEPHKAAGEHILAAVDDRIRTELFAQEDLETLVNDAAKHGRSVAEVLDQLREPRPNGEISLPWLGEVESRERIIRLCARGTIAINLGRDWLQTKPGEDEEDAWNRMKGRLPLGKALGGVTIHPPGAAVISGGGDPGKGTSTTGDDEDDQGAGGDTDTGGGTSTDTGGGTGGGTGAGEGGGLFGDDDGGVKERVPRSAPPTAPINLIGKLESWGINAGTPVHNLKISVDQLTGAQLQDLLKKLPDGVTYGLDLEKE
ncbi:MAG: DUF499 domain-containing protein [Chromatiaceae bacterium]|nr:MAG: DUF499 domain-containing protein [Chromatiaceae bacterium]